MLRAVVVLMMFALLTACASPASRNDARWQAYAQITATSAEAQRQAAAEQSAQFDRLAASCPALDGACVVAVAGFKAMAQQSAAGPAQSAIPAPPLERDFAAKARDLLSGISPLASTLAGAAVNYRQSDNALRTAEAQYGFLSNTVGAIATVADGAQPNISVGGNWGDTYGDDYTGGNRTDVGGDSIGGDRISDSTVGAGNRVGSHDIRDSYNGGDCTSAPGGQGGTNGAGNTGTAPGGPSTGCQAGDGGG